MLNEQRFKRWRYAKYEDAGGAQRINSFAKTFASFAFKVFPVMHMNSDLVLRVCRNRQQRPDSVASIGVE